MACYRKEIKYRSLIELKENETVDTEFMDFLGKKSGKSLFLSEQ